MRKHSAFFSQGYSWSPGTLLFLATHILFPFSYYPDALLTHTSLPRQHFATCLPSFGEKTPLHLTPRRQATLKSFAKPRKSKQSKGRIKDLEEKSRVSRQASPRAVLQLRAARPEARRSPLCAGAQPCLRTHSTSCSFLSEDVPSTFPRG